MLFTSSLFGLASLLALVSAAPVTSPIAIRDTPINGSYHTGGLRRWSGPYDESNTKRASPIWTTGDANNGGPGVTIHNVGTQTFRYYMYENSQDTSPYKYTSVAPNAVVFLSVPSGFAGRITRGTDAMNLAGKANLLGSWFEFTLEGNVMWGDVSLIKGCDGAISFGNTDGTNLHKGFSQDIIDGAPNAAFQQRPDGQWDLGYTEADGNIPANTAALNYELQVVGATNAYLDDAHGGGSVINSQNGQMYVTMHQWEFKDSAQVGH